MLIILCVLVLCSFAGSSSEYIDNGLFHRCFDEGEAYSGSLLITAEHMLETNLSNARVTTELASFVFMETRKVSKFKAEIGAVIQTRDVLDLSVIHLSAYERSLRSLGMNDVSGPAIDRIRRVARAQQKNARMSGKHTLFLDRTLVVMPWAGLSKGVGNSKLGLRKIYLKACFWSFYAVYDNIVIAVSSEDEADIVKNILDLPAMEVFVLDMNNDVQGLPMASLVYVQRKIRSQWGKSYNFILYSESDQMLLFNPHRMEDMYALLLKYPRRVLVPHRLIPYAHEVMKQYGYIHRNALFAYDSASMRSNSSRQPSALSCCLPRQNCVDREDWVKIGDKQLPLMTYDGMLVALGNANFRDETFRPCTLREAKEGRMKDLCP